MYATLLFLHSILRWLVLGSGLAALVLAVRGTQSQQQVTPGQRKAALAFLISTDVQFLLGLGLLALSPIAASAFGDFGAAMKDATLRFWTVEHPVQMLVAIALLHIGYAKAKRATQAPVAHKAMLIFFGLALFVIAASIPWPFRAIGRPWLPTF